MIISMTQEEIGRHLRLSSHFAGWPNAAILHAAQDAVAHRFSSGEAVFSAGRRTFGAFWLVVQGFVFNQRSSPKGTRCIFEMLVPGQATGIVPTFDGRGAAFDFVAKTDATVLQIPRKRIFECAEMPGVAEQIFTLFCVRARLDYETIHKTTFNSPKVRLAKTLVHAVRGRTQESGLAQLPVSFSQEEIADWMGVSRQTINKILGELRDEGAVDWRHRNIKTVHVEKLTQIGLSEGEVQIDVVGSFLAAPWALKGHEPGN